jgi:hypothetical protein
VLNVVHSQGQDGYRSTLDIIQSVQFVFMWKSFVCLNVQCIPYFLQNCMFSYLTYIYIIFHVGSTVNTLSYLANGLHLVWRALLRFLLIVADLRWLFMLIMLISICWLLPFRQLIHWMV